MTEQNTRAASQVSHNRQYNKYQDMSKSCISSAENIIDDVSETMKQDANQYLQSDEGNESQIHINVDFSHINGGH
jgi:hypothetical protein